MSINLRNLKESANKAQNKTVKPKEVGNIHTFHVVWKDSVTGDVRVLNGVKCDGMFTSKIPSIEERLKIGYIIAELCNGTPFQNLDIFTQNLIMWLATTSVCLIDKPEWFDDIAGQETLEPLQMVYNEIIKHQDKFFRSMPDGQESGTRTGQNVIIESDLGDDVSSTGNNGKQVVGK